jgi:predicted nucleotidyltransferase
MGELGELLDEHASSRSQLLGDITASLVQVSEVAGAVLYGSLGRGSADAWSDVDLVVLLEPGAVGSLIDERERWPARFGEPLYVLDSTWNAPLVGAQLNVLYELRSGLPVYVDWNLWPVSMAAHPSDTKLLFRRDDELVPDVSATFEDWATYERQPRPAPDEVTEDFLRHAHFGMVPIAAKYCARRDTERASQLLRGIGATAVPDSPTGQLDVTRERLAALSGGESDKAIAAVGRLCDAAEATLLSHR